MAPVEGLDCDHYHDWKWGGQWWLAVQGNLKGAKGLEPVGYRQPLVHPEPRTLAEVWAMKATDHLKRGNVVSSLCLLSWHDCESGST